MTHQLPIKPLLVKAKPVVIGVITARQNDNIKDAHLLIHGYLKEADKDGYRLTQAWSQLFAAATLLIADLIQRQATANGEEITDTIQGLGMELLNCKPDNG
jgi:hypothetical protein